MALFPTKRSILKLSGSTSHLSQKKSDGGGKKSGGKVKSTPKKDTPTSSDTTAADTNTESWFHMPVQLAKRLHEMPRIFRMKVHKQLSLRLNTNIPLAISKLREHHGDDCWIGSQLEAVWYCMAATTPPKLLIFELYYGEELIAADFGHPMNNGYSVYIATRFFDRSSLEIRTIMPGFVLALAECKVLQCLGCELWDLGGVNLCPLMRYKLDLTGAPVERPVAMYEHLKLHRKATTLPHGSIGMSSLTAGVLVESITLNDLLGYNEWRWRR